jgi:hypothetical protein
MAAWNASRNGTEAVPYRVKMSWLTKLLAIGLI